MRVLVLFLMFLSFQPFVQAKGGYFDFLPLDSTIDLSGEVKLNFSYSLVGGEESRFRIRPITSEVTHIWKESEGIWVSKDIYWAKLPNLNKSLALRFPNLGFDVTEVFFQVQDVNTAVIYETPRRKIWSRNWFVRYVQKLNERILRVVEYSSETS